MIQKHQLHEIFTWIKPRKKISTFQEWKCRSAFENQPLKRFISRKWHFCRKTHSNVIFRGGVQFKSAVKLSSRSAFYSRSKREKKNAVFKCFSTVLDFVSHRICSLIRRYTVKRSNNHLKNIRFKMVHEEKPTRKKPRCNVIKHSGNVLA